MTHPLAAASICVTAGFAVLGWLFVEGMKVALAMNEVAHD